MLRRAVARWHLSAPAGVALLLVAASHEACATALGGVASSAGILAGLGALLIVKLWPAHLPVSALSTAGGALAVAAGAAWAWRARAPLRLSGPVEAPSLPRPVMRSVPAATVDLPADLDRVALLQELRLHFVALQAAWDRGAMPDLHRMTTPEMFAELCFDWPGAAQSPSRTDVVTLHAELLGFEEIAQAQLATVAFSGLIREHAGEGAAPFRELWMLTRSKQSGAAWRLARQQTLL